ncbi:PAB-dependent poly(A)-specific ribonuclease subunit 3 [Recurvomyces mirabilis]|uniref:PAN2-PAN3 deadenylation complex subunit PAN3 n=1 Tax=Recurvomyces mirabilis TaxID=574656 RepID=A0AAE0WFG8_9PEZI|nr:PAB-dependent poly(A)-specific ribonuclease subunit 3 [Recurvomyces mirabilis]KAK5161025.1 PAB-dependent poly(A)-specific ribonuclease subunit 3 [Recurvomyces mirabilis]
MQANGLSNTQKKSLNVESPAFTPNLTPQNAKALPAKSLGLSPKVAAAATFTPRGSGSVTPATISHSKHTSDEFIPQNAFQPQQHFNEFVPGQNFVPQPQLESPPQIHQQVNPYGDPFMSAQTLQQTLPSLDGTQAQINPYSQAAPAVSTQPYYQDSSSYKHPLNYHLYASVGPRRENMQPYQRASADFFIPDNLREDLHKRSEAALQVFANSTLPQSLEHFHSLVALDTNSQRSTTTFGYASWIYKATSSKDGHTYALRRIEGFRLTNEQAIRNFQAWKRLSSAGVVRVHDAFTGRWFGDSSLVIVTDYHPLSQTVGDKHFNQARPGKTGTQFVPENDLWGYIVQLASALKAVHEAGLAAQTVTASKVLITSKNRLRLSGCGVLDITQYEQRLPTTELQRQDLQDLGRLILGIASRNPTAHQNVHKSLDFISRAYSERFRSCLAWLLAPPFSTSSADGLLGPASPSSDDGVARTLSEYNISNLLTNIADKVVLVLDSTLQYEDETTNNLMRELENGRLVRLLAKLNVILERPDPSTTSTSTTTTTNLNQPSSAWSETGERYYLKLFRDYVFHQCDHEGRPVLNLGHIVTCLNKLDAGVDEMIQLISRDEQNIFIVSFREVKRGFEAAWAEISRGAAAGGGGGGRR